MLLELNDVYNARLEPEHAREPLAPGDRARGRERQPDDARVDAARRRTPGGARGQARRGRGGARAGARAVRRERGSPDDGPDVELARGSSSGRRRDLRRAEELLRDAIRVLKPLEDRGTLVESQRLLAQVLLEEGSLDEAERLALDARETVGARRRQLRLDDATRPRSRPRRPEAGRGGGAAAARGRGVLRPTGLPPSPDRATRGPRRLPRARGPGRRGTRGRGDACARCSASPPPPGLWSLSLRRSVRIALIAWLEASSGDSEITVAGRSKRSSASRSGSARSVPSP